MTSHTQVDLIQGTLDMLVLRSLQPGRAHGFAIARFIKTASSEHLKVEEGSLYPALHRMERRGWIESEWGLSESNRRAKYYQLTASGKKQLKVEVARWSQMVEAIDAVLNFAQQQVTPCL
ncbi:MAG: PadR family transcriptional regulator [Pirellulales bacterium]|nr:PadR family transcriptional regulator [Pirellulales bacterium]